MARITNFSICHPKHDHIQQDSKPCNILWLKPTVSEAKVSHQFSFPTLDFSLLTADLFSKSAGIQQSSHKPCQWQIVHSAWEQHEALLIPILWLFILVTPNWGSRIFDHFVLLINKPHFQMHHSELPKIFIQYIREVKQVSTTEWTWDCLTASLSNRPFHLAWAKLRKQ